MKKKKFELIVVIAMMLTLIINTTCVSANDKTNDDYSIPQKIIDIANGSDEIYGEGVPIEHIDPNKPQPKFTSGGIDHTHQYIVASALVILSNDQGTSVLNNADYADTLMLSTDWLDKLGNETDYGTFSGHFYDPDTEKNWLGQTSPTAKTRAASYFNKAVEAYTQGQIESAMVYIGRGSHYVSDLNEPHHASNLTAINSNHTAFETYVDEHRNEYKISGNTLSEGIYTDATSMEINSLLKNAAKQAKNIVGEAQNESTYSSAGDKCVKNAVVTVVQYFYKFGTTVGIY